MFKNYFKIAWRNITRQKGYSGINIIGLAIGIAACLLILQYVSFELSYEDFQVNKDRIYRVKQDRFDNGKLSTEWAAGAYAIGNSFKEAIPEIEEYVKLQQNGNVIAEVKDQPLKIDNVFFSTTSFFTVFTFPVLQGDGSKALLEPNTAALSEKTARLLYGTTDVIGKRLRLNRNSDYKVTAVYKDAPSNTQVKPEILLSWPTLTNYFGENGTENRWFQDGCLTYLLLRPGTDPAVVEKKFLPVVDKFTAEFMKRYNSAVTYTLQPLSDIHLYSHYIMEPGPTGDGKTVYLLLGIAFFIALIAWINYINLATARAVNRAKEVGIRKTIGSRRRQLIVQFLAESTLLNGMALVLALVIVLVAIPGFNKLSEQVISYSLFGNIRFWLGLIALLIIGVFFSGLYPAFVLSGFKPIEVLKGRMISGSRGSLLRKSLVVFQFAASFFLLAGTLVVYRQIQFMRKQKLGLNIDQTLVVRSPLVVTDSTYVKDMSALKETLNRQTAIKGVAISTSIPGEPVKWNAGGIKIAGTDENTQKQYRVIGVDYDYLGMYGLKLITGRTFSKEFGTDDRAVLFNRKGFEQLGLEKPEDAIGKKIDFWGEQYTIVGVTENFHQQSLREAFEPLIFRLIPDVRGYMSVRTSAENASQTVTEVKKAWNDFFPGNTFEYFFLDDHFNDQYNADQRFGQIFGLFTSFALLVACMGLFGLASFTTIQRTKEIGIRKVLGASVVGILRLLYKEFALLILIAFIVAAPIAWFAMDKWLEGYPFRTGIHWSYFILPFLTIMLVALSTVSFQTIKAAIANPVRSLRTE